MAGGTDMAGAEEMGARETGGGELTRGERRQSSPEVAAVFDPVIAEFFSS